MDEQERAEEEKKSLDQSDSLIEPTPEPIKPYLVEESTEGM